jgi:hypothetical protein
LRVIRYGTGDILRVMERTRATWTDERLDDLTRRVEDGFRRVDEDIRALSGRIDGLSSRFDAMQRTLIQIGGVMIATTLATLVTVLAQ